MDMEIGMDKFVIPNLTTLYVKSLSILLRALHGRPTKGQLLAYRSVVAIPFFEDNSKS